MAEHRDSGHGRVAVLLGARALRVLGLALASLAALALFPHLGARSSGPRMPAIGSERVGGFRVAVPLYRLASRDPSRIASFSFRLAPVTPGTSVRAGVSRRDLADSCRLGVVTSGVATVTCSYDAGREPRVRDASSLTVFAAR